MKRFLAAVTALILLLTSSNAMALESTYDEISPKYDYVYGYAGEYAIVYIAPDSFNDYYKTVDIVFYYYHIKSDTVPFYFVKDDIVIPIERAIENGIYKEVLLEASVILKEAEVNRLEPFVSGNVSMSLIKPSPQETPDAPPPVEEPTWNETEPATIPHPNIPVPATDSSTNKGDDSKDGKKQNTSTRSASPKLNIKTATLKCGKRFKLSVKNKNGKSVKFSSSSKKIAVVNKKGIVTTLRRGRAKITAKIGNKKLTCVVKVVTSPSLSKSKVTVKKGASVVLKINGKADNVKNKYKNCKYAKVISKNSASTIKIKGIKKGSGVIKIIVNKMTLRLKVKVKK